MDKLVNIGAVLVFGVLAFVGLKFVQKSDDDDKTAKKESDILSDTSNSQESVSGRKAIEIHNVLDDLITWKTEVFNVMITVIDFPKVAEIYQSLYNVSISTDIQNDWKLDSNDARNALKMAAKQFVPNKDNLKIISDIDKMTSYAARKSNIQSIYKAGQWKELPVMPWESGGLVVSVRLNNQTSAPVWMYLDDLEAVY
jgi:hypothetical protein